MNCFQVFQSSPTETSDALRDWEPGRPITGTLAKIDLSGTVELILRLQPGTREILVISGASDSDRWRQSDCRRQLEQLEKRVKLTYMDAGSVHGFRENRCTGSRRNGDFVSFHVRRFSGKQIT